MIEERDANPTADTPGRFRGRRAPTALTAGGTESSEVVARLSGTESSNPLPSSGESANHRFRDDFTGSTPRDPAPDVAADLIQLRCLLVDIDIEFDAEQ